MNTTIYHNPRCSKSRQCLAILEENTKNINIVKYLDTPLTKTEIVNMLQLLNIKPIALVRKGETQWKEYFKNKELTDDEIVDAMVQYPKLIERPIVIKGNKAIIGRPPENVLSLL